MDDHQNYSVLYYAHNGALVCVLICLLQITAGISFCELLTYFFITMASLLILGLLFMAAL